MVEKLEGNIKSTVRENRERDNKVREEVAHIADARTALNTAHKQTLASANFPPPSKTSEKNGSETAKPGTPLKETVANKPKEGGGVKEMVVLKEGAKPSIATNKEIPAQPKQASNAATLPNNPATLQKPSASVFTNVVAPQPDAILAQLLATTKKPVTPATQEPQHQPQAKQAVEAKVVIPSQPAPQGEQIAGRDKKEFGKEGKKEGEKSERSKTKQAGGKGALAEAEESSSEGQKLEAASSGVTSGFGNDPCWIADEKPVKETFNIETTHDVNLEEVLVRRDWFNKYILKNPQETQHAAVIFENAVALNQDPELEKLLELGLAARLNSYGGMRG